MQPATALHAVRILGVDVANLSARCAVYQAAAEEITELASLIDVRSWQTQQQGEGDQVRTVTVIPVEHREAIELLLDAVDGLR